ncbi:ferredoxin [Streptomyces mayteni]
MRVAVFTDKCCGSGQCVLTAPDVFEQRAEDGIVALVDATPPAEYHANVRESAILCPTGAIEFTE